MPTADKGYMLTCHFGLDIFDLEKQVSTSSLRFAFPEGCARLIQHTLSAVVAIMISIQGRFQAAYSLRFVQISYSCIVRYDVTASQASEQVGKRTGWLPAVDVRASVDKLTVSSRHEG